MKWKRLIPTPYYLKNGSLAKIATGCHFSSFNATGCHSLSLVVPLVVIRCHSLSLVVPLVVTRCHSLSLVVLVVTRCITRCHLLPFVVTRCTTCYHLLSLVVPLVVPRCHSLSLDIPLVCLFINDCCDVLTFFLLNTFYRDTSFDVWKVELLCLKSCRQFPAFLNDSVSVYSIKLKIGMSYHKSNTFRSTIF